MTRLGSKRVGELLVAFVVGPLCVDGSDRRGFFSCPVPLPQVQSKWGRVHVQRTRSRALPKDKSLFFILPILFFSVLSIIIYFVQFSYPSIFENSFMGGTGNRLGRFEAKGR